VILIDSWIPTDCASLVLAIKESTLAETVALMFLVDQMKGLQPLAHVLHAILAREQIQVEDNAHKIHAI
jgi:hypothetical protein